MSWWKRRDPEPAPEGAPDTEALRARCTDLEARLAFAESALKERSEMLYELQQHYSAEHFGLSESMRNLKIERMRNAGAFAGLDLVLDRGRALQRRIAELKARLRAYETVADELFDDEPMLIEDAPPPSP